MIHPLTTEQLRVLVDAMGDGKNPPKFTKDPRVNHAIDCLMAEAGEEPEYDERLNTEEIEAAKAAGLI